MTKTSRNIAAAAEEAFHKHYAAIWGQQRWEESLHPALREPTRHAALVNRYAPIEGFWNCMDNSGVSKDELSQLILPQINSAATINFICYGRSCVEQTASQPSERVEAMSFPIPSSVLVPSTEQHVQSHWNLDAASILAAHLLDVRPGDIVLDLCAAPGGKSIALAQKLWPCLFPNTGDAAAIEGFGGSLRANEIDRPRNKRLTQNLMAYLPRGAIKAGLVSVSRIDATLPGPGLSALAVKSGYDKILIDAPCSSERHIIHAHARAQVSGQMSVDMAGWRPTMSKKLAKTQVELLLSALRLAKPGARLIYATCSVEPTENDEVIDKAFAALEKERRKGAKYTMKVLDLDEPLRAELAQWGEQTRHGWIVLPDHPTGHKWGPLYFAMLTKVPQSA